MGPLEGLLVVDLTRVLAGPFATMILRDLGARVLKIEIPGGGDEARGVPPFKKGVSAYFMSINRGKESLTLNLKHPRGRKVFLDLVGRADVLVENFRPGVMEGLGLGYARLREENRRLIYAACSGFGQDGPLAARPAYDMIVQGMGGIISITGQPGSEPTRVGVSIGDLSAALFTAVGILAALHDRERTGEGQLVDVAMLDSIVALLENAIARFDVTGEVPGPLGARHPSVTPFEVFRSADGHVILAISNEAQWGRFCLHLGRTDLVEDPRFHNNAARCEHYDALRPLIQEFLRHKATEEWVEELTAIGVPCGPLNNVAQVVESPQIRAREMIVRVVHATAGAFRVPGIPIKLSRHRLKVNQPAPDLGEHSSAILHEMGYSQEEIDLLRREGAI